MSTKIKCGISSKDFRAAAKAVQEYKQGLQKKIYSLVQALANQGAIIARTLVIELDAVDKGYLADQIGAFYDPTSNIGFIRVDCDYAVFVEFGTGVRGTEAPYPGDAIKNVAYRYGDGTHYVQLNDGRVGWFYPGDDGKMHFTEGMPSRPFMYETGQLLHKQLASMVREAFK